MPVVLTAASCCRYPAGVPESKGLDDATSTAQLEQLWRYVERQWLTIANMDPSRLLVRENKVRTNNAVKSFHAALRGRVEVSHHDL